MTTAGFERLYKDGVDPAKVGYPGFGYRRTIENGMIIGKDVAVLEQSLRGESLSSAKRRE